MSIDKILNKTDWYKHCSICGDVYEWDFKTKLFNTLDYCDKTSLPKEFKDYHISSGYCQPCLKEQFPRAYKAMKQREKDGL